MKMKTHISVFWKLFYIFPILITILLMTSCVISSITGHPSRWEPFLVGKDGQCPDISGKYTKYGEWGKGYSDWKNDRPPSLLLMLRDIDRHPHAIVNKSHYGANYRDLTTTDYHAIKSIEFIQKKEMVIIKGWSDDHTVWQKIIPRKGTNLVCKNGLIELIYKYDDISSINGTKITAFVKNHTGHLIVRVTEKSIEPALIPIFLKEEQWYMFAPYKK